MHLSLIIPAHNEEHRLPPTLKAIDAYLDHQPYASEIVVVENGSQDLTPVVPFCLVQPTRRVCWSPGTKT